MKAMGIKDLRNMVQGHLPAEGKSADIPVGLVFSNHDLMKMRAELYDSGYIVSFGGSGNSMFLRIRHPKHEPHHNSPPYKKNAYAMS